MDSVNPVTKIAQLIGKQRWLPAIGKRLVPVDLAIQRRTGGRVSLLRAAGLPYLVLTTTGRKTGQPRSVPLLYAPHGSGFLVVGSNWGERNHPAWSANLLANADARVEVRGRVVPVRARLLTGEERARLWREVLVSLWPAYDIYAERAGGREVRVFELSPRS